MKEEQESVIEQGENFKISLFDLDGEGISIPEIDKELEKEAKIEKPEEPAKPEDKSEESSTGEDNEEDSEESTEDNKVADESSETTELNEYEKALSEFIAEGNLLLPEDYEYEPTKEGFQKALLDSEKMRNELAFTEAIQFLLSEDGMNFAKVQAARKEIVDIEKINAEDLDADEKLNFIRESYKIKGFEESELNDVIEGIIDSDKIDAEFNVATKFIKKVKEKEIAKEAERVQQERKAAEENYKKSQAELKQKLETTTEINGYPLTTTGKTKIFDMVYKPVKAKDGSITTEFNMRLQKIFEDPNQFLIIADLLANMDEKGLNFNNLLTKAETKAVKVVKKTLRDLKDSNNKSKVSGKISATQSEFDLAKYSLLNFK